VEGDVGNARPTARFCLAMEMLTLVRGVTTLPSSPMMT
jgi:hypothetical protein